MSAVRHWRAISYLHGTVKVRHMTIVEVTQSGPRLVIISKVFRGSNQRTIQCETQCTDLCTVDACAGVQIGRSGSVCIVQLATPTRCFVLDILADGAPKILAFAKQVHLQRITSSCNIRLNVNLMAYCMKCRCSRTKRSPRSSMIQPLTLTLSNREAIVWRNSLAR